MAAPADFSRYGAFPVFPTPRQSGHTPFGQRLARIPVAAAAHLRPLLTGAPRVATVLSSGRLAAYLRVEIDAADAPPHARPQVVAVVAPDAVVPAGALVLPAGVSPDVVLPVGRKVAIGDGRLVTDMPTGTMTGEHAHHVILQPARWFAAPRVVAGQPSASALRVLADRLAALPAPPRTVARARSNAVTAASALAEGRRDDATELLSARLGLGPGATPSGDDVAAGVLMAARADTATFEQGDVDDVADRVAHLATVRTTAVSAALLADAAAGWCTEPVARALAVLAPPAGHRLPTQRENTSATELDRALDSLLALGHHSGADLATGILAVLTTGTAQPNDNHHDKEERA